MDFLASGNPGWGDMTTTRARDWVAVPPPMIWVRSQVYQDPDVVCFADGTVRVSFGVRNDALRGAPLVAMLQVTGAHDDACRDWTDAWSNRTDAKVDDSESPKEKSARRSPRTDRSKRTSGSAAGRAAPRRAEIRSKREEAPPDVPLAVGEHREGGDAPG